MNEFLKAIAEYPMQFTAVAVTLITIAWAFGSSFSVGHRSIIESYSHHFSQVFAAFLLLVLFHFYFL